MALDVLISEFHASENALRRSILDEADAETSASLLKRCADVLDKIERFQPESAEERQDKSFFFLRRGLSGKSITLNGRDIDIALALAQSEPGDVAGETLQDSRPLPSGAGLIDYVRTSTERVSIIDSEFRYVATSEANAQFYDTRPVRLIGTHLTRTIGDARFRYRAQERIAACIDGEPQEYYHHDEPSDAPRIWRCQMKPVHLPGLGPFALVYTQDVTALVERGVNPEPLVPAAAAGHDNGAQRPSEY